MTVIAVANQKGGVAKTTTAVTLAHGAALQGKNVLLVDLDSQGNVSDSLGIDAAPSIFSWLGQGEPLEKVVFNARTNLGVVRGNKTTTFLKTMLASMDFREYVLANKLDGYIYDLVILDCAPSVDVLHTAALVASDFLLIPTRLDQFAVKGVTEILQSLQSVLRTSNSRCKVAGVLPTFYDKVTRESHDQLINLATGFKSYLWPVIPADTACRVANREGKTLWEFDPKCRALTGGNQPGGYMEALKRLMRLL